MHQDNVPPELAALVQQTAGGFRYIHSPVCSTSSGTPYLCAPGVAIIARPQTNIGGLAPFLQGFEPSLQFENYLQDPHALPPAAALCKTAGQLCYASFGPKRTHNKDAARYFQNILSSGHGSVLEHATFSFLLYGISRSVTHEIVRHRAGMAYSQISQRYVSGSVLRFVERPEYTADPQLHHAFEMRIDRAAAEYAQTAERLMALQQEGSSLLSAEARTDLRKKVQQAARSLLPNETEAPLIMTANVRAWRHFLEMRANTHAEVEIRALALRIALCLSAEEPILFSDYRFLPQKDGVWSVETDTPKV